MPPTTAADQVQAAYTRALQAGDAKAARCLGWLLVLAVPDEECLTLPPPAPAVPEPVPGSRQARFCGGAIRGEMPLARPFLVPPDPGAEDEQEGNAGSAEEHEREPSG